MRKLLSVLLAVVMVASVAVVSFSAAGADQLTVTLTDFKGQTVTQTYKVGETFTAYAYLNINGIGESRIGSLKGEQSYDASLLEIADEYNKDTSSYDFGAIKDMNAMFPIIGSGAVASAGRSGSIHYNASIASYNGYLFDSDDCAMIIVNYTVKAPGKTTITNKMPTLALSDYHLTRIIDKGVIVDDSFKTSAKLSEPETPVVTGSKVSGTVTSYTTLAGTENEAVTIELVQGGATVYSTAAVGNSASFEIADVADGDYTIRFSKRNHVTRDYKLTVAGDTTAESATICPIGDANQDGSLSVLDINRINLQLKNKRNLGEYEALCGDANQDGGLTVLDINRINLQLKNKRSLWA